MASHLETNLGLLQELINKDPESYKEEFLGEYKFYIKTIQLMKLQPSLNHADLQSLLELINFLAATSSHYPKEGKEYAANIMEILNSRLTGLDPQIRVAFCKALITLRNRRIIDSLAVIDLFFTLILCEDKNLSEKRGIFILFFDYLTFDIFPVLIDGFRKGFLRDAKTANALAECCLHKISRIQVC
ncbi:unnamed protein product, partial [Onchocerca flexuosa]|uniref:Protein SDA1 n=1 Tax=Onchocerca flexuosa TaxID=387005 RepID=A0A183H4Z4_9BILA